MTRMDKDEDGLQQYEIAALALSLLTVPSPKLIKFPKLQTLYLPRFNSGNQTAPQ